MLSNERVHETLKEAGVLLEGHFLLSSGRHSDRYLQVSRAFKNPTFGELLCETLAEKFRDSSVELVIAPSIGAIQMAYQMSRLLRCENCYAGREEGRMTLRRGFEILPGQRVLLVEDVIAAGGSVREAIDLVREKSGVIVGVGVIIDRTGGLIDFGVPLRSVMSMKAESWEPEECPLCSSGEPLEKPESRKLPHK